MCIRDRLDGCRQDTHWVCEFRRGILQPALADIACDLANRLSFALHLNVADVYKRQGKVEGEILKESDAKTARLLESPVERKYGSICFAP